MPSDFGHIETNRGKTQEGGSRPRISHRRNTVSQMSNHRDDISDFGDQVSIQQRSTLEGGRGAKFVGTAPVKGGHGQAFDDLYSPATPVRKVRLGQQE